MSINIQRAAWMIGIMIVAAAILRQPAVFLLATTLGVGLGISYLWATYSLQGVTYARTITHPRIFFGENVDLLVDISNPKLLPLPWLEVEDQVPSWFQINGVELWPHHNPRRASLVMAFVLRWYERVRRRYTIAGHKRGLHTLGPATIRSWDLSGLFEQREAIEQTDHLIVYPRVVPITRPQIAAARPAGSLKGNPWLFEDPERISGIREYTSSDPVRRIHWKATARTGCLQVKQYQPTYSTSLAVFLDVTTYQELWEKIDEQLFEFGIVTTASLLYDGYEQGLSVGLYTNGTTAGSRMPMKVPPGRSARHMIDILEVLAVIGPASAISLADLISAERSGFGFGTTIVAVTCTADSELVDSLERCQTYGNPTSLILTRRSDVNLPVPTFVAVEEGTSGESTITIR